MAAAVAVPLSAINNELGGVLPPSALVQHSPRHGRSRAMSFKGKNGNRGRGYSVHEDRDVSIAKALMFVLKRTVKEEEVDEEDEEDHRLVADAEGWVDLDDVLEHEKLKALEADLEDIQRVISSASKPRFHIRQANPTKDNAEDPSTYTIRRIPTKRDSITAPIPTGDKLTLTTPDLPEFLVYETSYQRYPLILTTGTISRAPGGTEYLVFTPVTASDESRPLQQQGEAAEVSIWINLKSALEANPELLFQRTESGVIVTSDEIPKALWKKAVARRPDLGVLFEDGEVRKEIPAGLRGKGKGKARKGKEGRGQAQGLKRDGSEESGSGSEAVEEEDEE